MGRSIRWFDSLLCNGDRIQADISDMHQRLNPEWTTETIDSTTDWLMDLCDTYPGAIDWAIRNEQESSAISEDLEVVAPGLLSRVEETLFCGYGFIILRTGLPSQEGAARSLFLTIGRAFGENVSRDAVGKECDWLELKSIADPTFDGVYSGNAFHDQMVGYHVDGGGDDDREVNVLGLMCAVKAARGGETIVANAAMAVRDLPLRIARQLEEPWLRTHPYEPRTLDRMHRAPVVSSLDGSKEVEFSYHFQRLRNALRLQGEPDDSERFQALDSLDDSLGRYSCRFLLEPGDLLFLNNRTLAHARTAFKDDPERPRRLLRLWVGERCDPMLRRASS